jgi:hypothetical protein
VGVAATGKLVRFEFNGADVTVHPGQTTEEINAEVARQWDANAAAYRASPEGQRDAIEAAERLAKSQADHDSLTEEMQAAFAGEGTMMDWLDRFCEAADHVGVKGKRFLDVIAALEAAGYARNAATGYAPEAYDNPEIMARYIAGQALDSMYMGLPPHPLTHKFVAQYRDATGRQGRCCRAPAAVTESLLEG